VEGMDFSGEETLVVVVVVVVPMTVQWAEEAGEGDRQVVVVVRQVYSACLKKQISEEMWAWGIDVVLLAVDLEPVFLYDRQPPWSGFGGCHGR